MRLRAIGCEVLFRELSYAAARSPHCVDLEFLSKGLHDQGPAAMRARLQELIDQTEASRHDAVVLGYGLCGNGIAGLEARAVPLVAPRMHDCIGLLLGSRERFERYFEDNPGTYFRSTGWLERGAGMEPLARSRTGSGFTLAEFIEKYGEDNGRFLFEEMTRYQSAYSQLTYIRTGLEPDGGFEEQARQEAARRGWRYSAVEGSLALFERLFSGDWPAEEFAVARPGERIAARYDGTVLGSEAV